MSSPRDTSKFNTTDALLFFAEAMGTGGTSGAIERQEKQAQVELLNSTVIPTEIHGGTEADLTALGFKLGAAVEGDPLFRHAELPAGWTREGSDHAMWSYLLDEQGRRRCSVFFKGAFYDRKADMGIETVYSYVGHCLSEKTAPVLDDVWATPKAVRAAAAGQLARSAKSLEMYAHRTDDYGRERTAELKAEIAACNELYASLSVSSGEAESLAEPLVDPDCRDGKCHSCVGGPCEHSCHQGDSGEAETRG
ncbi:hypothetical protein AB0F88_39805 [Streptosporangium sp. NPDC023963]|uniref:hypothetical protein n=1 Tax=Streptosporangium sp. NPDC023963 TaxID=3155608 RepID=UPI00342D1284